MANDLHYSNICLMFALKLKNSKIFSCFSNLKMSSNLQKTHIKVLFKT